MQRLRPERWARVSPLLEEALDLPTDQRGRYVAALAATDATLAADLDLLLRDHVRLAGAGFLDVPLVGPPPATLAGHVVGAYRLVSPLGTGGSGSVWLAERCDGRFEGRVAVKLLDLALVGRSGERRFRREGTILARLQHPRIAHLIDAGVSDTGQPYLVLEYVDGERIDTYCDRERLDVPGRLRLFLDVLDAVAYAHAHLTVHRDIKPENVLVDADGHVKLLDFGIAKLLDPEGDADSADSSEAAALTREIGRALTPAYAAPEQVTGRAVTTATDVHALGLLLSVLLTGRHPLGSDRSPATLLRAIVDVDPPAVSEAVMAPAPGEPDPHEHAARLGTTPARLRRLLRGDLDTIVATALKKDPAARYVSVEAMAGDIRRYLQHEPILAKPDSVAYRAARFVRRHARAVSVSVLVVATVALLTTVYMVGLAAARDKARLETEKAVKVNELLLQILAGADPYAPGGGGQTLAARTLLDAQAAQVASVLSGRPELQADLLITMGRTYRKLGAYDRAQQLLEQGLASAEQAFGREHERVATALNDLGVLSMERGDYGSAQARLERALAMRRRLLGSGHADVALTLVELARVYQDRGDNQRAAPLQREALAIRRAALGEHHPETAVSLSAVASALRLDGDLTGAETLLRECLEINRRTRGARNPNTALTLHDLALIASERGDHASAVATLREALAMLREGLGPTHPNVAMMLRTLAHELRAQGRLREAAATLDEAVSAARTALGDEHQLVAIYLLERADLHRVSGQPDLARALAEEALRIRALAPDVVPMRRRAFADDAWSLEDGRRLLARLATSR